MPKTITSGDIQAIQATSTLLNDEFVVYVLVAGEWIEIIKQEGERVAKISKQIDLPELQRLYNEQSKIPFEPEF